MLSDPEKKRIYDQQGEEGLKHASGAGGRGPQGGAGGFQFHGQDPFDMFKNFFGGDGGGGGFSFGGGGGGGFPGGGFSGEISFSSPPFLSP